MKFNLVNPKVGDVVQILSDTWYVWVLDQLNRGYWREMSSEEHLEYTNQY